MTIPVILSGGSGTRLWPLSRAAHPKQFIRQLNGHGSSLLGAMLERLAPKAGFAAPIVVCNDEHRFLVRDEARRAGIEPQAVILEPVARNTAAAVAVAALVAERQSPGAVLAVMPSDHVVLDEKAFAERVETAARIAAADKLVLFGIKPREPHTGYGYIRGGAPIGGLDGGYSVDAFCEKPDRDTAEAYIADGSYFWNSGIFVFRARTILDEYQHFAPDILAAADAALESASEDLGFLRLHAAFADARSTSIDYAVMEKTKAAAMLPLDVGWSDVGSWSSLWETTPQDGSGNAIRGDALLMDATGCYVHSERSLVAAIGVKDLVVVDTPDALLVADRGRSQDVSKLVTVLRQSNRKEYDQHLMCHRPWGYFESLNLGDRFQVKLLHVSPGAMLSLQMHHHRSEHWVVVRGTAKVTIGDVEKLVQENESVYITATQWHRLENPGKVPLEIIEVQIGSYLGEDDIIRSQDIYRREHDQPAR
jgi:mannose-1-phosphate guanylyltransferase/mannose-6-phosphate isomerase